MPDCISSATERSGPPNATSAHKPIVVADLGVSSVERFAALCNLWLDPFSVFGLKCAKRGRFAYFEETVRLSGRVSH
jgi:hypothetical protein